VISIAAKHGKTAAQTLLRWGLQHGTSVIPKSSKAQHSQVCFELYSVYMLTSHLQYMRGECWTLCISELLKSSKAKHSAIVCFAQRHNMFSLYALTTSVHLHNMYSQSMAWFA